MDEFQWNVEICHIIQSQPGVGRSVVETDRTESFFNTDFAISDKTQGQTSNCWVGSFHILPSNQFIL